MPEQHLGASAVKTFDARLTPAPRSAQSAAIAVQEHERHYLPLVFGLAMGMFSVLVRNLLLQFI
jgi:hypothetical protein